MFRSLCLAAAAACLFSAAPRIAGAQDIDRVVSAELRPGWRQADGTHMAALHLKLAPGWKTYWRAPGDAGIPPEFGWRGSANLSGVSVVWPRPDVFEQGGMRSIGYHDEVILPLAIRPASGGDVRLAGDMRLGICKDICMPHELSFSAVLPAAPSPRDPAIVAALADRPFTAADVGGASAQCRVDPSEKGMTLTAEIAVDPAGTREDVVIETGNPLLWVSEPRSRREGGTLVTRAEVRHVEKRPFALDRSSLTFTVLGSSHAVEIEGCSR
jgi:DsbC/DsbD-like thiol-disulfide interchange protein